MAKLNQITIGGKLYIEVNANPVGLQAPVGSAAVWNNGGVGKYFFKNGVSDTAWEEIPTLSALEKLVSDEATARDAAISSAVSAEATARDAAIAVEATARARADLAEITDRKAEDAKLQKAIDDEVLARQTADESLQDQIDAEVLARKAADEALSKIKTFSSTQSYLKDQFVYVDGATAETFNGGSGIYFAKQDITAGAFNDSQWQYAGTPFDTKDGLSFSIDVGANGTLTIGINDNGIAPEKIQSLPISKVTGLQSELDKKMDKAGGTMTGDLNMGEKKITNVSVIEGKKVTTGVAPINGMQVTVGSFRFADGTRWDGSLLFTYRNDVRFNQKVFSYLHSQVEGGPNAWDIFHAAFPTATDFSTDRGLLSIYDINNNKVCEVTYAGTGYIVNSWMAQDNAMNLIEGYGAYDNNFTMIDSQSVVETPVAFSTGIDAGGKVVKNVGPAISDTDAINKAQLTSAINSVSDGAGESVAQEVSDRIAADTDLKSELQTDYNAKFDLTASAKELFDEVAARKAADAILQGSINALSNNLNWRPGCIAATADADLASAVDGTVLSTLLPFSDDAAPIMDASGFKAGQFIVCKNGSSSKVFKIVSGSSTSIMTKETMGTNNAGVFYYMQYELGNPNYSLTAAEYSSIQVGDSVTASGNGSPVVVTTVESKAIVFDGVSGQNQYVITLTEKTGWQSPTFLAFTISSNALQVTTVGVEVPKVGDAFIVQNDFPASPNENETVAVYSFSGSDMVRIGTFAWNLATGINLNTFVASPGLVITGDTIQAAIQKLVGNLEAEITARQNAINTEITAREAAIAVEATARADADLAEITAREAAIAVEATARAAADLAEITARNAAIASNAWHLEIVGNVDSSLELAVSGQAVEQKYFETMYASAISPFSDISVDRKSEVSIERKSKLVATLRFYAELKISGVTKVLSFKKTFTSKDDVVLLVQDEYTQEDIDLIGANLSISVSSEGNYTTVSATITGLPTFDEGTLWGMMHLDTLAR